MLPNFFIPGAPRCGTTALALCLDQHSEVLISDPKEPRIFELHFGDDRYARQCFAGYSGQRAVGDGSVTYLAAPVVPDRIASTVPDARFIVCLRDPVDRTVSHYNHRVANGVESRSFGEVIRIDRADIIRHSMYATNLRPWWNRFPADQFLYLDLNDLNDAMPRVCDFLGIGQKPTEIVVANAARHNRSPAALKALRLAHSHRLTRLLPRGLRRWAQNQVSRAHSMSRNVSITAPTEHERQILIDRFAPEVEALGTLVDTSAWRPFRTP